MTLKELWLPLALLLLAAVLCALGARVRKLRWMTYLGGAVWVAAEILGMLRGASQSALLLSVLLLLLVTFAFGKRGDGS